MFKDNNKDTKTTSLTLNIFHIFFSVFIVEFGQVNNCWVNIFPGLQSPFNSAFASIHF